jgi:hypothetical protein
MEETMRSSLQIFCLLVVLSFGVGCAESTQGAATPTVPLALPAGAVVDTQGVLIGPKGGNLTRVGDYFLEAVFLQSGTVQLYAYDARGEAFPVSNLDMHQLSLQTNRGMINVPLQQGDDYHLVGYYDPFYYDPFFYGSYPYFNVFYPEVIVIKNTPSRVYPTFYRGTGSNNTARGYSTNPSPRGYSSKSTGVMAPVSPRQGYSAQKSKPK